VFSAHQILAGVLRTGEMLAELPGDLGHADTLNAAGTAHMNIPLS
jgi:hypothetical protein